MLGVISNIQRFTVHDGPGIRLTIFMQGCPLACWWCHNPESIRSCNHKDADSISRFSVSELMKEIKKEQIFMDESIGGVTFSGGEPMMQAIFLEEILKACEEEDIHTAVDTSGLVSTDTFHSLMDKPDLFLYDLKVINNTLHKKYTGASNILILENLRTLNKYHKNVIIRIPLIPEITNTKDNIQDIKNLLLDLPNIKKINLLPYHRIAAGKYERLNLENKMQGIKPENNSKNEEIKSLFTEAGFDTSLNV